MAGILGTFCTSEKDLKKATSERRKRYRELSVLNDQIERFEQDGWETTRRGKTTTRVRKLKDPDVLFEDRVWMIFYGLGFARMNKDQNCKLQFNTLTKQIDVLTIEEDNIFIVECKSSQAEAPVPARDALEYWNGKLGDAHKAIAAECGRKHGRLNVVVAISSEHKRDIDEAYAAEIQHKNIFLWSARELYYIEKLIQQVGSAAKYQIYSLIFAGKKQSILRKNCPAISGKIGGHTFYTFLLSAKDLLKYAYVHHRDLAGIVEASDVYQRMLKKDKLREIAKFIELEGGYFPNSIIVNFTKRLYWSKKESFDNGIAMGMLTLPKYFGSAWVIDGQHRLYGVARANRDILLPILAFQNLNQLDQANLFVEINERQTKVPKDLLWDLYSDIYRNSADEKQKSRFQMAETAKNMEGDGPLKGCIEIPSISAKRPVKLSLTTVCSTIEKFSPWEKLKHPTDESRTPENAARILNAYFAILRELWPEDWAKGSKSVLLSNNGFGVFTMIFHDVLNHMAYKHKLGLLQPGKTAELKELLRNAYLAPVIQYLKTDEDLQKSIRRATGRGPQSVNAGILEINIRDAMPDFWSARLGGEISKPIGQEPETIPNIERKASRAEPVLREFILERLKMHYGGDKWWRQGIPGDPKRRANDEWTRLTRRLPYTREVENQNERKFEFLGLGDMIEIVVYRPNWQQIFEPLFGDKAHYERRIKDIIVLRNPVSHTRRMEDQDTIDGISGLLWLSQCIGNEELNPLTDKSA